MSKIFKREKQRENLTENVLDILVVGGGITGAGVVRDAAMQGFTAGLVEKGDFAEGTSSRSSKLAHGGLRYLENYEFGLVGEALKERQNLLRMAPTFVEPLRFLMPLYKGDRVGPFKMGLGMQFYDFLSLGDTPQAHERLSEKEIKNGYPLLKKEGLKGGFLYSDANMDDDRLVLETLRSALTYGANAISYCEASEIKIKNEVVEVGCIDHIQDKKIVIRARHLVACVGPWTDMFGKIVDKKWSTRMRPSKGIHITLPKEILNLKTALVMGADNQQRILFCIPRADFDIVGTTDTDFIEDPSVVRTEAEDVEYVLKILKEYFPEADVTKEKILFTYAGVRPLVDDESETESRTSRAHWIKTFPKEKVTFITGGKYTTYLSMAEDCVEEVANYVDKEKKERVDTRVSLNPANTVENIKLAKKNVEECNFENLNKQEAIKFVQRYGLLGLEYLQGYAGENYFELEAKVSIREYLCFTIKDFYFRRTHFLLQGVDVVRSSLADVKKIFQKELGLSNSEVEVQEQELWDAINYESAWRQRELTPK